MSSIFHLLASSSSSESGSGGGIVVVNGTCTIARTLGYNGIEHGPTHGNTPSWPVHVARPTVSSSVVVAVALVSVVAPTPHHPPLRLRQLHHDRKQRGRSVVVVAAGEAGCGRCLAAWSVLVAHESTHAATRKHTCTDTGTR